MIFIIKIFACLSGGFSSILHLLWIGLQHLNKITAFRLIFAVLNTFRKLCIGIL